MNLLGRSGVYPRPLIARRQEEHGERFARFYMKRGLVPLVRAVCRGE